MNKSLALVLIIVAFLVGAFAGYYIQRSRAISKLDETKMVMQKTIDEATATAKKASDELAALKETATASNLVVMAKNAKLGTIATDANGMTLYTYDKDTTGKSNCTGTCAANWPPYVETGTVATTLPAHLSAIKRADGSMQYAWDGKPLYRYVGDKKAGDTAGDGFGGVWHVVK